MSDTFNTDLIQAGGLIRAYLEPLWVRMASSKAKFRPNNWKADIASTGMCLHTSLFTRRLFDSIGDKGWDLASGQLDRFGMPIPGWDTRLPAHIAAENHWWLQHSEHGWFDLTADQFGLPELILGQPGDETFSLYTKDAENRRVANIQGMMRNWEGDERGSWWGHETQAEAYAQLQQDVREALGMALKLDDAPGIRM